MGGGGQQLGGSVDHQGVVQRGRVLPSRASALTMQLSSSHLSSGPGQAAPRAPPGAIPAAGAPQPRAAGTTLPEGGLGLVQSLKPLPAEPPGAPPMDKPHGG